ncbi:MAG: TonB-dependent receptor [Verrucomicrobia bacterium]|nr:TonB-dependent receptor [Verrucomicrobiota bacterium]
MPNREAFHSNLFRLRLVNMCLVGACVLTLMPGAITSVEAQAVTATATPSASPGSTPAPTSETAEAERVTVTANKREENIQEVPSSVSVINDVEMDNLHATQLTDYAPYVPGLQVNSFGTPGQVTISLRGLAPLSSGSTVSTYIDETPVGSSGIYQRATLFQLDLLPYDIRRVEILRGPQGTLYGANSLGGLVKYVTLDPSLTDDEFRFGGGVSGVSGSDDIGWDVHIGGNIPLLSNQLGLRLSYARNELPGFIDNVVNGAKDINSSTQQSALASVLWQPNDVVAVRLLALGQRIESDNNNIVALDATTRQPLFGDLTNEVYVDEPFKKTIGLIAGTVDINLGFAALTSATGYSNTETDQREDATKTYGAAPMLLGFDFSGIAGFDISLNLDKFTQELRLTSKADQAFLWQIGGFFTYERAANGQLVFLRQLNGAPFTGADALLNTLANLEIPSTYKEYAGFANASYNFTDRLSLGAGLRYSRNEQDFSENVTEGILLPIANTPGSSSESILDFMVTPKYKIDDTKTLYVRIASGYQPGGPNVALPGVPPSVGSETAISYEGGLKSEFFDHKLLFDVAGYHIDLSNIQVGTVVNNVSALVNGKGATSNGAEFTLGYQPIKELSFAVNGAYTDATLSDDAPSLMGKAGDRLPFIPEFQVSFTADYFFPLWGAHNSAAASSVAPVDAKDGKHIVSAPVAGAAASAGWNGHLGLGVRYVSDSYSAVESSPTAYRQDSYAALDLTADITNGRYTVRAFARNVTDNRAYETIVPVMTLTGAVDHLSATPIQPRTVGIEFDFRF